MEIKLVNIGKHKIEVIKLIRLFSGLGLRESKELADKIPSTFHVKNTEIELKQIKKNFAAIGATIEKVEKIVPVEKSVSNVPGEDLSEKTPIPKKTIKTKYTKKEKKVYEKPKFTEQKTKTTYTDDKFYNLNKKADDLFFLKSVKSSIAIAMVGAAIFGISNFYYPFSMFLAFLIIAVIIAFTLRSTNNRTSKELGILAASFTIFSFIIYPFFSNILFAAVYGDMYYLQSTNIFFRLFSIFNPTIIIPTIIAYLIASNADFGEKLNAVFRKGNKSAKSNFNSKSYQRGKRSIRRKKRKLD